jgi:hypothetical protein
LSLNQGKKSLRVNSDAVSIVSLINLF